MSDKKQLFPTVALRGITVLPGTTINFDINLPESLKVMEEAMLNGTLVFCPTIKNYEVASPELKDFYEHGVFIKVKQVIRVKQQLARVLATGVKKGRILDYFEGDDYHMAEVEELNLNESSYDEMTESGLVYTLRETLDRFLSSIGAGKINENWVISIRSSASLRQVLNLIENHAIVDLAHKMQILATDNIDDECAAVLHILSAETKAYEIKNELNQAVKAKIDKNQKEYILREEMKVIRKELGQDEDEESECDRFRKEIDELNANDNVKDKLRKEVRRLERMSSGSSESAVIRGYLETCLELPWNNEKEETLDIERAENILNEDHYGLKDAKDRVIEFLAVKALRPEANGKIILLVGPPGTGKTSIAKSVARALSREYVRISLGGVKDEAEIRGHRKTYVGAMPGRIVEALRDAKVANPLILLDEIDKAGRDHKGDTASALLEVLDGEQNKNFRDHYVEIPIDLSRVFFIATANSTDTIPPALLDRMDVIRVSSYTENEKYHIAKEHLWPKQLEENGLKDYKISITDEALRKVIVNYTREAGVRNLERRIGEIMRKAAKAIIKDRNVKIRVNKNNLKDYLGIEKHRPDEKNKRPLEGVVRGLAWTQVGGETLEIEVVTLPGKGELILTGQMGDVMQESAMIGLSFVRSISSKHGVKKEAFMNNDIHLHIPEGATPKDGPSAGVTMCVALLSALSKTKVRADIAMTGEIDLRGRVLPVGGLKEKLLAAKNIGIMEVIVPYNNKADIEELDEEIIGDMTLHYVKEFKEAYSIATNKGE